MHVEWGSKMATSSNHAPLLSERLRPQSIDDLVLPKSTIKALKTMLAKNCTPNMLFSGMPGAGKTSAAKCLAENFDTLFLNGSDHRREKATLTQITMFASSLSLFLQPKLCLLDEGDYIPRESQAALRGIIERFSSSCRFLITANDPSRLLPAIRSRLYEINFDIRELDRDELTNGYAQRLNEKLKQLKINVDTDWLMERISLRFPDFRAIALDLEFELLKH
jgi:DNA polymerase III delta prime subunit